MALTGWCERCGGTFPYLDMLWIPWSPEEDSNSRLVCNSCEQRLACTEHEPPRTCCVWCGHRSARTERHLARQAERANRQLWKDELLRAQREQDWVYVGGAIRSDPLVRDDSFGHGSRWRSYDGVRLRATGPAPGSLP